MTPALKSYFSSVSWDADCRIQRRISVLQADESENEEVAMLYAILAYHVEAEVISWSAEEDTVLMANLREAHDRLNQVGRLGPAARLGETKTARTLRGAGDGMMIDGPFAETKEQLLGFYVVDVPDEDAAEDAVRHLRRANPTAVYEVRPIRLFIPGAAFPETAAEN
jgi:hypothetical protein